MLHLKVWGGGHWNVPVASSLCDSCICVLSATQGSSGPTVSLSQMKRTELGSPQPQLAPTSLGGIPPSAKRLCAKHPLCRLQGSGKREVAKRTPQGCPGREGCHPLASSRRAPRNVDHSQVGRGWWLSGRRTRSTGLRGISKTGRGGGLLSTWGRGRRGE